MPVLARIAVKSYRLRALLGGSDATAADDETDEDSGGVDIRAAEDITPFALPR